MTKLICNMFNYNTFVGKAFYAQHEYAMSASSTVYFYGVTPANLNVYMEDRAVKCLSSNQDINVDIRLFEGTVVSSNGTAVDVFATNRNNGFTNKFQIFHTPTVTTEGTDIKRGTKVRGLKNEGIVESDKAPYIMKKDTNYLLKITNNSANPVDVIVFWSWWENGDVV